MPARLTLAILAILPLLAALPAAGESFRHDGVERRYLIEEPAQKPDRPPPAILVLHGGGGSAGQIRRQARFRLPQRGWVALYPEGMGRHWNDGRLTADGRPLRHGDDVGFLRGLIGQLAAEGRIDPERVFVAGVSNGGGMALRLICEAPELIAGAAVAIMTFPEGVTCHTRRPVPLLYLLSDADPLVPFGGGPVVLGASDRGRVLSAEAAFALFARRNRCGAPVSERLPDRDPADGIRIRLIEWRGCRAPLRALVAEGGGHAWFGARERPLLRRVVGPTPQDVSATLEIERFFAPLAR